MEWRTNLSKWWILWFCNIGCIWFYFGQTSKFWNLWKIILFSFKIGVSWIRSCFSAWHCNNQLYACWNIRNRYCNKTFSSSTKFLSTGWNGPNSANSQSLSSISKSQNDYSQIEVLQPLSKFLIFLFKKTQDFSSFDVVIIY